MGAVPVFKRCSAELTRGGAEGRTAGMHGSPWTEPAGGLEQHPRAEAAPWTHSVSTSGRDQESEISRAADLKVALRPTGLAEPI